MATVYTFSIKQSDGSIVEIDANKTPIEKLADLNTAIGVAGESASPAGGAGTLNAKMRKMTDQLETVSLVTGDITGTKTVLYSYLPTINLNTGYLAAMAPNLATIAGAVAGTEMQVDVAGSLPAGTATIGGTLDAGPAWTTVWGVSNAPVQSADMTAEADVTGTPVSGQKLVITDVLCSASTAMKLTFAEETSGLVMFSVYLAANSPVILSFRSKRKLNVANKKLRCTASVAGNVSILVGHYSEA